MVANIQVDKDLTIRDYIYKTIAQNKKLNRLSAS